MVFAKKEELSEWLDKVLYTDNDRILYRDNQIQMGNTCIPILGQKNRRQLQRLLLELFTPFLPFLRAEKLSTYEPSMPARREYLRYHADGLMEDFLDEEDPPVLAIVDLSSQYVMLYRIYIQELHRQELDLTPLWKFLVMHFLVEQTFPISYLVTKNQVVLDEEKSGIHMDIICKDTCVYERLFMEYHAVAGQLYGMYAMYHGEEYEAER